MTLILDESEDIQENVIKSILSPLGRNRTVSFVSRFVLFCPSCISVHPVVVYLNADSFSVFIMVHFLHSSCSIIFHETLVTRVSLKLLGDLLWILLNSVLGNLNHT